MKPTNTMHILLRPFQNQNTAGMTLIEIIIVMAILGGLMGVIITGIMGAWDKVKIDEAKVRMGQLSQPLIMYRAHTRRFPTSDQGLNALLENPGVKGWRGPYIDDDEIFFDPWGNEFTLQTAGNSFRLLSAGEDGLFETDDDIEYKKGRQQARN